MQKKKKFKTTFRFKVESENKNTSNSSSKGSTRKPKGSSNISVAKKKKKRTTALINAKSEVHEGRVILDLPIRTVSEANSFERWQIKHGRHKQQQRIVFEALEPLKGNITLPCRIMFTRFAPDFLDKFDNLPMSFKYIVDAVCAIITGEYRAGKADSDERISMACDQVESKEYGIRIEIMYDC